MKKKYNPFKMWGSYVGAVILFLFNGVYGRIDLLSNILLFPEYLLRYILSNFSHTCYQLLCPESLIVLWIILSIITGFLIGWAIHSLIRKYVR